MDKLPAELFDNIASNLTDDIAALKTLRLVTRSVGAAAIKYLYKNIVLRNTECSWNKFHAVIMDPFFSHFVRSLEFSGHHKGTCLVSSSTNCHHSSCRVEMKTLDKPGLLGDASNGISTLKISGKYVRFLPIIALSFAFVNVRKLELDLTLQRCSSRKCDRQCSYPHVSQILETSHLAALKSSVRDLSITYGESGGGNLNSRGIFVPTGLTAGWSGLETLNLKRWGFHTEALFFLLRSNSKTLVSLTITEPFLIPDTWFPSEQKLREMAPKLEHLHYTLAWPMKS